MDGYVFLACNEMSKIKKQISKADGVLRSTRFVLLLWNKSSFLVHKQTLVLMI